MMIDHDVINLSPRLQVIYYEKDDNELGKEYVTSDKRISLDEAHAILFHRNIDFKELLKVKYEIINVTMEIEEFKKYII